MEIITHEEAPQGSDKWFDFKRGVPSASNAAKILSKTGKSGQRKKYLYRLAGERRSGITQAGYKNATMQEGNDKETDSCLKYEVMNNVTLCKVSCIFPDEKRRYLCSPDRLLWAKRRGFETKNVTTETKVKYPYAAQVERLRRQAPDPKHWCQMQMSMLITGWSEWIYQSYCEGLPTLTLVIKKDTEYCVRLKHELDKFCDELDAMCGWLESLK